MPEGDSIARAAARLAPLVSHAIVEADGVPAIRSWRPKLIGQTITGVRTHGKHLLVDIQGEISIHVWLGMPGRWRIARRDGSGRTETEGERSGALLEPGAIRLLVGTATHRATCYSAPTVEVDRTRVIENRLRRLGPDVLDEDFDFASFRARVSLLPAQTSICDALLDQRVLSGIGNEYKNEVLFLEGVHPATRLGDLTPERLDRMAARANRIMRPNAERRGDRNTTGLPHALSWVYGRAGAPCRRCHNPILSDRIGARFPRITYWCPLCQPAPPDQAQSRS